MDINEVNEKSMEVLANIADPYFELMKDKEFMTLYMTDGTAAIKYACTKKPKEAVAIAAALKGVPVDEYVVDPFILPLTLMAAMASYRKISTDLFTSQVQKSEEASSGLATESTEAIVQPTNS